MDHKLNFLVIDKSHEDALFYQKLLDKGPFLPFHCKITHVSTLAAGLSCLHQETFHLILTNLELEDIQGMDTLNHLLETASQIPIVILTESGNENQAVEAIAKGAQDYLLKSELDVHFFSRIVRFALERHTLSQALKELSFNDELTGIYNRRGFLTLADQQLELAKRLNRGFFLILFDLDYLKHINDTYGHKQGDRAIVLAAECLKKTFRSSDILGRIGGDEFAALVLQSEKEDEKAIERNFRRSLKELNTQNSAPYEVDLTLGMAYYDPSSGNGSIEALFENADQLLYAHKRARALKR